MKCFFMTGHHRFVKVAGTQQQITDALTDLHEQDRWYGIHGGWQFADGPSIDGLGSCQTDPKKSPDENRRLIIDSVAAAFEYAAGRGTS
jgi:hypothetical protein